MVQDQRDLIRIVGIGAHGAHRLLDVQRERLGRPHQDHAIAIRHIEALAKQINVAKDRDLAASEPLYGGLSLRLWRCTIKVHSIDALLPESGRCALAGGDRRAIHDGLLALGQLQPVFNGTAKDGTLIHKRFNLSLVVVAAFGMQLTGIRQLHAVIFVRCQVMILDEPLCRH